MSKIYKLSIPNFYPNKRIACYEWQERKTDAYAFMRCNYIDPHQDFDLLLNVSSLKKHIVIYDVLPSNFGSPLVKGKALEILRELCPNAFQMFDAVVYTKDEIVHDFKILNLLTEIKGINFEKSKCEYMVCGALLGYDKLVMHPGSMDGVHIGRLEQTHSKILMSDTLVDAFKKAKIKGVDFIPIEVA